jgi:6-phosphogluconolactonase (cycloisomerase 2 family)
MVGCGGGGSDSATPPPSTYTVGGTVTGLSGSGLVLQNEGGADLPISTSGTFTFPTRVPSGTFYAVTVKGFPTSPLQACLVANGAGTIAAADVTNVSVTCQNGHLVSGTVSGLAVGSGLGVGICANGPRDSINCHDWLGVDANGTITLNAVYPAGYSGPDSVALTEPSSPPQRCLISNAAVSIEVATGTGFTVTCAAYSYVTNAADNTLSAYSVDPTTGMLAVVGTPISTGTSPYATVGCVTNQRYVYVGNEGSNDVSAFAVDGVTGALTAVPGSPFAAGTDPQAIACLGEVGALYVANAGSDNVFGYNIDANTGALSAPSTIATGKNPTSIALARPYLTFVYVANHGGSNDITAFNVDLTPVPGSPFPVGGNPLSLAVGAGGKFLYSAIPDATNPSISGFSIDWASGALSPLSGSPFPLPVSHYIATDQTGAYLYVTSGASIVGYAIDAATGALIALPGFPVAAGANAYSISIDPGNQFLYVANDGGANISGFKLDASTGALTPMAGSPFPAGNHPKFMATF